MRLNLSGRGTSFYIQQPLISCIRHVYILQYSKTLPPFLPGFAHLINVFAGSFLGSYERKIVSSFACKFQWIDLVEPCFYFKGSVSRDFSGLFWPVWIDLGLYKNL
jgi:hypothetical protein